MGNTYETSYGRPIAVDIKVPAEMLETIGGYPDSERLDRELSFALSAADLDDPTTLQWIAALLEAKLIEGAKCPGLPDDEDCLDDPQNPCANCRARGDADEASGCPKCGARTLPPAVMPERTRFCQKCGSYFKPREAVGR